ncbi:MAG TPA: patatin-like phospholipase family protein [Syntrophales bacterium]|nr:patatin-like phospholipase family protein [Syntrophales bacterium]
MVRPQFDQSILALQGGGALGAYQAGVYEGLAEAGILPTWVVGISIGSINAAIIAGNPPERRVERLRTFWDRVSSYAPLTPPAWLDAMRPALNNVSAASVMSFGIPGFFVPRVPPPIFAPDNTLGALSYYDTSPLNRTLEELVDFDLINSRRVRLSLGAVSVREGKSVYFDNSRTRIGADHVRASGSLPPGFPPVTIDGIQYWDGGIVTNSPLAYVAEEKPRTRVLAIEVDVFNAKGGLPRNLDQVMERAKDIQYASKLFLNIDHIRELGEMRAALGRLFCKLPDGLKDDPDAQKLAPLCDDREFTIARMINRRTTSSGNTKDYEFSRATVNEAWAAGLEDVRRSKASIERIQPAGLAPGVRVYDLPPEADIPGILADEKKEQINDE